MKRPAGKRPASARAQVAKCVRNMVPKKRTAYALYMEEQYPIVKADVLAEGTWGPADRPQRVIVHRIAKGWQDLETEGRRPYEQKARNEFESQSAAIRSLFDERAQPSTGHAGNAVGQWTFGEAIWTCGNSAAYKVEHKVLHTRAMATIFSNATDFEQELLVLKELEKERDAFFHELYLLAMEITPTEHPLQCIIQECLPTLEEYKQRSERIEGTKLASIAVQVSLALHQLHSLKFLHLDVRAKAVHFDERAQCAKLARFHRARSFTDPLVYAPYVGSYRPPECWGLERGFPVGLGTEAWAFGVTLIEVASAMELFTGAEQIMQFKMDPRVIHKNEALMAIPEKVRSVLLRFLLPAQERLSIRTFVAEKERFFKDLSNGRP